MPYRPEDRYYRSPSRQSAPVVGTAPGIFGIGSFRSGQTSRFQSPRNIGGTQSSSLWELLKGAASQTMGAMQTLQPRDPLEALLDQLSGLIGGGGGGGYGGDFSAQARADAAAQYDPQIAAINSAMSRGRRSTEYNKSGIDSLYDALAASYPADVAASRETFKGARDTEKQISEEGSAAISGGYQQAQQNLANVMQQLGIQEAAPGVLPELAQDQARMLAGEAERSAAEQSAYGRQGTAAEQYYEQGPSLAHMAGTQGQQYLTEQLNQFLLDQEAQRGQLESQKALTYNALLGKYRSEYGQQQQAQQNTQFNQLRGLLSSVLAVKNFQRGDVSAGPKPSYEGLTGAAQVLGENLGQGRGTQLEGALMNFLSEEIAKSPRNPSYPEALNMLRDYAEDQGYSTMDMNALAKALAAYYGVY